MGAVGAGEALGDGRGGHAKIGASDSERWMWRISQERPFLL